MQATVLFKNSFENNTSSRSARSLLIQVLYHEGMCFSFLFKIVGKKKRGLRYSIDIVVKCRSL